MPRHDYKCIDCGTTEERFVPLKDFPQSQFCDKCKAELERQFPKMGATHGDEAPWLNSTTEFLKEGEEKAIHKHPVSSRTEYNKLLKEKGLEPAG